ncbi:MAG: hypothetical protein M1410_01525 [Candidatus Thermoplasmatota archaeon]|jgi:hypothetical protein|nr:hypothetical protein [Candidatus Thermoplasmatota archaeon]
MYWTSGKIVALVAAIISVTSMYLYASTINASQTLSNSPQDYLPGNSALLFSLDYPGVPMYGFSLGSEFGIALNSGVSPEGTLINFSSTAFNSNHYAISGIGFYLGESIENLEISDINVSNGNVISQLLQYLVGSNSTSVNLTMCLVSGTEVVLLGTMGGIEDAIAAASLGTWHHVEFNGSGQYPVSIILYSGIPMFDWIWVNVTAFQTFLTVHMVSNSTAGEASSLLTILTGVRPYAVFGGSLEFVTDIGLARVFSLLLRGA